LVRRGGSVRECGTMLYERFVEVGRLCMVNYGEEAGRLVVIVEVIDQNRALCSGVGFGPGASFKRTVENYKRLSLTDLKVKVPVNAKERTVKAAVKKEGLEAAWGKTGWAKKVAKRAANKAMNDFDRHKAMVTKIKKAAKVRAQMK